MSETLRNGHCGHRPKCINVDDPDERDPFGCCNCGTRPREVAHSAICATNNAGQPNAVCSCGAEPRGEYEAAR